MGVRTMSSLLNANTAEGGCDLMMENLNIELFGGGCRKEKRKLAKKLKRKQIRKETALKEREEEEAKLNNEDEQQKLLLKEKEEEEMMEIQRNEFQERERLWLEKAAQRAHEEEEAQRKIFQQEQVDNENELEEEGEWEYIEEGPAEIIWEGNEIIVKKNRVRVPKGSANTQTSIENADRPTSNPLPPQSEAYASYKNTSVSAEQVFESVSQQTPNFGTEQDKAHCPFHIKTGACRFGVRCSRAHFYPDKSCTLLIKNMYTGPGLAWEQDEGLETLLCDIVCESTDEEIARSYEEFYEDVHTEFLKFGEIFNFKVCRNGSFHLRGNVYVHYKSLESAIHAYQAINGRYFASKQITCEFVGVTRWRVAICGEYMKSRLKTCSRGTACNFIHCFQNPCGDYEWADWDNPPPRYWVEKMVALFGPSDEVGSDKHMGQEHWSFPRDSKKIRPKHERRHSRRSKSKDSDSLSSTSSGGHSDRNRYLLSTPSNREEGSAISRKMISSTDESKRYEENSKSEGVDRYKEISIFRDHSSGDYSFKDRDKYYSRSRAHHRNEGRDHSDHHENVKKKHGSSDCEGKDQLHCHDSPRNYSDLGRKQKRTHSSRRVYVTGRIKAEDIHAEHKKSEISESNSPRSHGGRCDSHDSIETIDPSDRWESGTTVPCETDNSRSYSSEYNEPCEKMHRPHSQSTGVCFREIRSRSRSRSSRSHSIQWSEERESPGEDLHSRQDREHYHEKRISRRGHKKDNKPLNEGNSESFSSGDYRGESDIGHKEDPSLRNSGGHHMQKRSSSTDLRKDQRNRKRPKSGE